MRTLTLCPSLNGYRLAFVGPGDRFETIAEFASWDDGTAAFEAAQRAGELVLTVPYLHNRKAA